MKPTIAGIVLVSFVSLTGCNSGDRQTGEKPGGVDTAARLPEELNQRIARDTDNPDLFNQRAKHYLVARNFDAALRDINQAISLNDKKPDYYITLSDIQLLMGQTDNCQAALNRALQLDPSHRNAQLKRAKLYLILRNYAATFRALHEMIQQDTYQPQAYFIRAIALLETGDTAKAVRDLMKAVDQDQNYYEAYLQLGELFSIREDPLAEGYLTNALRVKPASKEALYLLGMHYQATGQLQKALAAYESLQRSHPAFRNAPYNKGYIYLVYLHDFPMAIESFTQAIQVDSGYVDAYYNRGYSYELIGQPDRAYADYKVTLKLDVNNPRAIAGMNRLEQAGFRR